MSGGGLREAPTLSACLGSVGRSAGTGQRRLLLQLAGRPVPVRPVPVAVPVVAVPVVAVPALIRRRGLGSRRRCGRDVRGHGRRSRSHGDGRGGLLSGRAVAVRTVSVRRALALTGGAVFVLDVCVLA